MVSPTPVRRAGSIADCVADRVRDNDLDAAIDEENMKLWLLTQSDNTAENTYDSAVVAAKTEADARSIHPSRDKAGSGFPSDDWASSPDSVIADLIGTAKDGTKRGVILASFNAG